jgi:hypothetical protein
MTGYQPPRARFRRRIAEELRLMTERMHSLGNDCFWILSLDPPTPEEGELLVAQRSVSRVRPRALVIGGNEAEREEDQGLSADLPDSDPSSYEGGGARRRSRFAQCLFEASRPYFVLDLPNSTLERPEAEVLLRERAGFVRAADQPGLRYSTKSLKEDDPLCRQYLHLDVDQAADDIAYVLFDLYALDVTTPLYQTTACFEGCACWYERGVPFETLTYPRPLGNEGCPRCRKTRRDA